MASNSSQVCIQPENGNERYDFVICDCFFSICHLFINIYSLFYLFIFDLRKFLQILLNKPKKITKESSIFTISLARMIIFCLNSIEWYLPISFIMDIVLPPKHLPTVQVRCLRRITIPLRIDRVSTSLYQGRYLSCKLDCISRLS